MKTKTLYLSRVDRKHVEIDNTLSWRAIKRIKAHTIHNIRHNKILDVSSSPRLWIDVFALPERFNMAATESDLDPKIRKMSITF